MSRMWRHACVWLLAIALIAGGLPLAHAMPCAPESAPGSSATAVSMHHDMPMAAAAGHDHHHHDMAQADPAPSSQPQDDNHSNHAAADICNCLNCNMCTTPAVAPFARSFQPERRSFTVSYCLAVTGDRRAPVFVDPGIPIRMA